MSGTPSPECPPATASPFAAARVREEAKPSPRAVWLVLARRKSVEALALVGTVIADEPELAMVFARSIYDEHPWIEMVVVPRSEVRTVIAS